jgi:hypothetical protein
MYVEKNTGIRAKMAEGRNQMLSLSFDKRVCVSNQFRNVLFLPK